MGDDQMSSRLEIKQAKEIIDEAKQDVESSQRDDISSQRKMISSKSPKKGEAKMVIQVGNRGEEEKGFGRVELDPQMFEQAKRYNAVKVTIAG
jgi:hypothetical protein